MTFPDPNFRRSSLSLLAVESKTCNLIKVNGNLKNNNNHYNMQLTKHTRHSISRIGNIKYTGKLIPKRAEKMGPHHG